MSVEVRDARPDEHTEVGRLTVEAYREYAEEFGPQIWPGYAADLQDVEARSKEASIIVAEEGSHLVGAVAYFPPGKKDVQIFPQEWGTIRVLAVLPSHRGMGVGKLLTEECLRRARADGAVAVGLHTTQLMTVAKEMYERMGFVIEQEFKTPSGFCYWAYSYPLGD